MADGQHLGPEAAALAARAADLHRREEVHADGEDARALAAFAASARDVEGEVARRQAALAALREDLPDRGEDVRVGRRVGAREAADGLLVDEDGLGQVLPAVDAVVLGGQVPGPVEVPAGGPAEDVQQQRRLAGAGRARDRHQAAQRYPYRQVLEVVGAGPADDDGRVAVAACAGAGRGEPARQVRAGHRALGAGDLLGRARRDDPAAVAPGARADVDHVVRGAQHVQVVLDDEHGVAEVAQAVQDVDQAGGVGGVQADGGLVEDVEHAGESGAEQGGQPQALRLPGGEAGGGLAEGEVADADVHEAPDPLLQVGDDRLHEQPLVPGGPLAQTGQPAVEVGQREPRRLHEGEAVHGHRPALRPQPGAAAVRAGLLHQALLFGTFAVVGVVGSVVVAAQQCRRHALEAARGDGGRRGRVREVPPELGAFDAVQQQVPLPGVQVVDRLVRVEGEAVVGGRGAQHGQGPLGVLRVPAPYRTVGDGPGAVDQALDVGPDHLAEAGAGRAGAGGLVEGEGAHDEFGHEGAAVRAGPLLGLGVLVGFGAVGVRGRDLLPAARAGPYPDAGPQQAQVREHLGDRADRGARAAVGVVLVDADGRRQAGDRVDGGLADEAGDHAQRLQVLPLALPVEGVEGEGGLAGAGQAGQDDQLVLREGEGDVPQVVQARTGDMNAGVHSFKSSIEVRC